jgi:uncharacterized membrane protein YdjX (TVP38/TMEM64 family)
VISRRTLVTLAIAGLALLALGLARRSLGIDADPAALQEAVARLGVWGPLAYVGLVALRIPLGLPSALVLLAGPLLFNTLTATLCGAAGLTLSAVAIFLIARHSGRARIEARLPGRLRPLLELASSRLGAVFIALGTAYPFGPITLYHLLAGVTGMGVVVFVLSVASGSLGRSALFTFFGRRLVEGDAGDLLEASLVVGVVVVLPLLIPRTRRWLLDAMRAGRSEPPQAPQP